MTEPLLTWKGRRVRSPGDTPEVIAQKVPTALRSGSLFFVPSPLEGWGIETLLDRLATDSVVVVFELDPELTLHCEQAWQEHLGPRISDPRLFRLAIDTEDSVRALFQKLRLNGIRRCELLTLNGAWLPQARRYREVFARLEEGVTRWWANRITCLHMGPLWVRNLLTNLSRLAWSPWPDWGQDTVLVCGAGPTLESALPWALIHRRRLRIVAADTALPVLKSFGLVPDAVVCLEAQHANLRDFAGWVGSDPLLFTDLTSLPASGRVFSLAPRWFISEFAPLSLWGRWPWPTEVVPRVPPLGSVGVAAAWIAWRLSQGRVILAGLDFSHPPGQTHARGAPSLQALASTTTRLKPMEQTRSWLGGGLKGAPNGRWLTSPVLEGYARVLADQARPHAHRTWVWSSLGLDLGLPVWSRTPQTETVPSKQSETMMTVTPQEWLAGEAELWRTILDDFERIQNRPEEAWADLETHLTMADYLTFWFPDPEFRRDTDWLVRAQYQVRWALQKFTSRD